MESLSQAEEPAKSGACVSVALVARAADGKGERMGPERGGQAPISHEAAHPSHTQVFGKYVIGKGYKPKER
jgi:hypothetical protein